MGQRNTGKGEGKGGTLQHGKIGEGMLEFFFFHLFLVEDEFFDDLVPLEGGALL